MKKLIALGLALALVSGCTTHNRVGDWVGVVDDKAPGLKYDLSYWNIFLGVVFSETLIVPAIVVAKDLECPRE